jgi:putative transcriptional regulator
MIDTQALEALLETARTLRRKRRARVARLLGIPVTEARPEATATIDVRAIRGRTGLSQAKFAELIDIELSTLRNWEQGRRQPTGPARALLRAIRNDTLAVMRALNH